MKKRVLFFACLSMLFSLSLKAQTVQLYRQTGDATSAVTEWTYTTSSGGDKITYPASSGTSTSNICAPAVRRVQVNAFILNYKTSSIGKIVISANSSGGTSARNLTGLKINDVDFTLTSSNNTSTVLGNGGTVGYSDCGDITITGLNIAKDATNGIKLDFTFSDNIRLNTISIWSIEALPLNFLSFTAKPDALGKTVNLNWQTANEVNTQDFVIERRSDDTEFSAIDVVSSKNEAGIHNYNFTDKKPLIGNTYYRLKQRDNDGKYTYSDVRSVTISGINLTMYPNPSTNELVVNHEYAKRPSEIKIIGMDGKTALKTNTYVGTSSTTINVSALSSGTYLLVYEVKNGKPKSQKFIKK